VITIYPRALLKAALLYGGFVSLLALGLDARLGLVAIGAAALLDWLSLLIPLFFGGDYRSTKR
jgi:hypothetical protein